MKLRKQSVTTSNNSLVYILFVMNYNSGSMLLKNVIKFTHSPFVFFHISSVFLCKNARNAVVVVGYEKVVV